MSHVFLLWHIYTSPSGNDEELLIGVYSSEGDAKSAQARLSDKPGFIQNPKGFTIASYELNRDHWTEGFVAV